MTTRPTRQTPEHVESCECGRCIRRRVWAILMREEQIARGLIQQERAAANTTGGPMTRETPERKR